MIDGNLLNTPFDLINQKVDIWHKFNMFIPLFNI